MLNVLGAGLGSVFGFWYFGMSYWRSVGRFGQVLPFVR